MLIVAALGGRSTGGYTIAVEEVRDRGDYIEALVVKEEPGERCGVTQAFTFPVDIVRLRRDERPVRFSERTVIHDCSR